MFVLVRFEVAAAFTDHHLLTVHFDRIEQFDACALAEDARPAPVIGQLPQYVPAMCFRHSDVFPIR